MGTIYVIELTGAASVSKYPTLFPMGGRRYAATSATCELLRKAHIPFVERDRANTEPLEKRIVFPLKSFLYSTPERGAIEEICAKMWASQHGGRIPYAVFLGRNINVEQGAFLLDKPGGHRNYQWKLTHTKPAERNMAEAFPKFLSLVHDPDTKFVVSFGSGGLRLFSQPSMMKFLNDIKARQHIDEIWGCSGGALSGLCYAMGVEPEAIEQKGYDIYNERFRLHLAPSALVIAKNAILRALMPTPPDLLEGFISVQDAMRAAIETLTADQKIEIPFYCVAYNVRTRRNEILTPLATDHPAYRDLVISTNAIDAVAASSSIPVIYVPKVIRRGRRKEQFIDGATAEPVPLLSVYRKWRLDQEHQLEKRRKLLILAIDPVPGEVKQSRLLSFVFNKLPFGDIARLGIGVLYMMMRARIHNHEEILEEDEHVRLVMLSLPLSSSSMLDTKEIPSIIQDAQTVLLEQMYKVEEAL
jgi:Patatin-like phospholipase